MCKRNREMDQGQRKQICNRKEPPNMLSVLISFEKGYFIIMNKIHEFDEFGYDQYDMDECFDRKCCV